MDRNLKIIRLTRFMALPLGLIMYVLTEESFGEYTAYMLGLTFCLAFYVMVRREEFRYVVESFKKALLKVLSPIGVENMVIDARRFSRGFITSVFIIGQFDAGRVNQMVRSYFTGSAYEKMTVALQVVVVPHIDILKKTRKKLNEDLVKRVIEDFKNRNNI